MDIERVKELALSELREEQFREAVEKYKDKLRQRKWWHVVLPFKIIIIRRSE